MRSSCEALVKRLIAPKLSIQHIIEKTGGQAWLKSETGAGSECPLPRRGERPKSGKFRVESGQKPRNLPARGLLAGSALSAAAPVL